MADTASLTQIKSDREREAERFGTDWLPTIALVRQGKQWSTSIAFSPSMITTGPDVFSLELRLFRDARVVGSFHAGPVSYPQTLRVDVADALEALSLSDYDGIAEVIVRGHGPWCDSRRVKCVLDVWMQVASQDGRFHVVGPTGQLAGSPRVRMNSQYAYESYPAVPLGGTFTTDLLVMNPYGIPVWMEISAYDNCGRSTRSGRIAVPKRQYMVVPLEDSLPDLQSDSLQWASIAVTSRYKLIMYCLFRNAFTGNVTSLDHTWPFLEFHRAD